MIKTFHVQNYKALRDVTLELTPIHVLIGPNDSGKTSLVEALAAQGRMARMGTESAFEGRWRGRELVWRHEPDKQIALEASVEENGIRLRHSISCRFVESGHSAEIAGESLVVENGAQIPMTRNANGSGLLLNRPEHSYVKALAQALSGMQSYRWIPSHLALPVAFQFSTQFGMEASGFGLAMYLNDILAYDHERFGELERRFTTFFPSVKRMRLRREEGFLTRLPVGPITSTSTGLGIHFEQAGEFLLPASQASDGMLLVLAYLAILHSPQPTRLLIVEEPENGVHPRRLQEVLGILRELVSEQDRTQVVLTTHSPYVVDQFKPEEVTLCLKGADGAVTTHRLSNSKSVREQMDIFQLGEIWTAEGDEALAAPAKVEEAATS